MKISIKIFTRKSVSIYIHFLEALGVTYKGRWFFSKVCEGSAYQGLIKPNTPPIGATDGKFKEGSGRPNHPLGPVLLMYMVSCT